MKASLKSAAVKRAETASSKPPPVGQKPPAFLYFSRTPEKCAVKPNFDAALLENQCYQKCDVAKKLKPAIRFAESRKDFSQKPEDWSDWYWKLKLNQFGKPPSTSHFRSAKYRWDEQNDAVSCAGPCQTKKFIHPYKPKKDRWMTGSEKRKVVERWARMWDSALSDLQFERTVFENNPDAEQMYKNDNERINDGCQKLCSIAKMNQNIITMMMKKFVSGPPNKLYTLNRIEAAQCWSRIIDDLGLVSSNCCVDLPVTPKKMQTIIPALRRPKFLRDPPDYLALKAETLKLPPLGSPEKRKEKERMETLCLAPENRTKAFRKNPTFWLDPNLVPPIPAGFIEEEFEVDPQKDPTGEIRRDLKKAKIMAKRYTRFAHIIEKATHVIPNIEKLHKTMDEHYVSDDPDVRRQTLLHHFFSSSKIETSPEYKKDAMFATILSTAENTKQSKKKKQFPYALAEMSKSKLKVHH